MIYKPKNFRVEELVTPDVYGLLGDNALKLLSPLLLQDIDLLQEKFGTCTINDWLWGGSYRESGLRNLHTKTGAARSMHKTGGAFDLKFKHVKPAHLCEYILANTALFVGIRRIENTKYTPSWIHVDDGGSHKSGIVVFNP